MARVRSQEEKLFGAACLKLALSQTQGVGAAENEIYKGTLSDLGLSDEDVDRYLDSNRDLVRNALSKRGRAGRS